VLNGDACDKHKELGPRGNPQAKNLFNVIGCLQRQAGVELHVALR